MDAQGQEVAIGVPAGSGPDSLTITSAVGLGERSFMDVLDQGIRLLRACLGAMLLASAVLVLPRELAVGWFNRELLGLMDAGQAFNDPTAFLIALESADTTAPAAVLTSLVAGLIGAPILALALCRIAAAWALSGQRLRTRDGWLWALRRGHRAIGAGLAVIAFTAAPFILGLIMLAAGAAGLGLLLMFLTLPLVIVVMPRYALIFAVMAAEDVGVRDALRTSWTRTASHWGRMIGLGVTVVVVAFMASAAIEGVPSLLALIVGDTLRWVAATVGTAAGALVVGPIYAAATVAADIDHRVRDEAIDLQVTVAELGARAG